MSRVHRLAGGLDGRRRPLRRRLLHRGEPERPAFQRLLEDIDAGRIDIVVVYKVDRLSRSLLDFAKLMDRFNEAKAAFVGVTQNFSTADAMGRLTRNVLMSFAEFERSMIAERTRDKVVAARRKGKWTGGPVPLGYRIVDGKLAVDDAEARVVRQRPQNGSITPSPRLPCSFSTRSGKSSGYIVK